MMAEQENYEGRSNGLSQAAKGMGISDRFRLFPLVGQGVGQWLLADRVARKREGAFVGEPQVPTTSERSGKPPAGAGFARVAKPGAPERKKAPESGSLFFLELVTRLVRATC